MREPLRVLIVDDDPGQREICRRFLALYFNDEHDVVEAARGSEGLALCRTVLPDCILLDYHLPDLDGLAFIKALGDEHDNVLSPVIMVTGGGSETLMAEAMQAGAADYLPKGTLSAERLARAVVNAVGAYRRRIAV